MNEQRERIARSMTSGFSRRVWDGDFNPSPEPEYNKAVRDHVRANYLNDADLIIAHLWQRADDPATYAEVAAKLYRRHDLNTFELGTAQQYISMMLETLIGPRPDTEQERER